MAGERETANQDHRTSKSVRLAARDSTCHGVARIELRWLDGRTRVFINIEHLTFELSGPRRQDAQGPE